MLKFKNQHTGQTIFTESDDGKLEIKDPETREQWEAQERIEESVKESVNVTESTGKPRLPVGDVFEAQKSHAQLHNWLKDGAPEGWTEDEVKEEHTKLTRFILANGWRHYNREDDLDGALTGDLAKRSAKVKESDITMLNQAHEKLHNAYGETKAEKLESLHQQVAIHMIEMGIDHTVTDKLDETLPANLKG